MEETQGWPKLKPEMGYDRNSQQHNCLVRLHLIGYYQILMGYNILSDDSITTRRLLEFLSCPYMDVNALSH